MTDIKEYLKKKEKKDKYQQGDFKRQIFTHRIKNLVIALCIVVSVAAFVGIGYIRMKNQSFTGYVTISETLRQLHRGATVRSYQNGYILYSKDGISYTDSKGNAIWNQTYQMQAPMVAIRDKWVAVSDYNGHIIYNINQEGAVSEIDTNLPIRQMTVSATGVVAAVLEDGAATWINVYNANGEKAVGIKTTMPKSGYPMAVALSDTGKLMQVAYLRAESGSMKGVVSFYNFDEVGQNYTDTMVSSYEYADAVIPFAAFMNAGTAFSVADNQLLIYEGTEIPKNIAQVFLNEEVQNVFYNENYIGLVFTGNDGNGKYRFDIYNREGAQVLSVPFQLEYKDIIFLKDSFVIYNEAECIITGLNGKEKYAGDITEQTALLKPIGTRRFLAVTQDSLDIIEMK